MKKNKLTKRPYWYIKRLFDILFSLLLIIITLPITLLTALVLHIDLKGPLFNEQRYREGLYKTPFLMLKLRTKKLSCDHLPRHERYSKVSNIIDRLHINELPQLFNILIGDMSFIGPRPFIPNETLPEGEISEKRYMVRPGLTGLSQVNGGIWTSHANKLKYDIIYYDNFGIIQDIKILFKTPIEIYRQSKNNYIEKYLQK